MVIYALGIILYSGYLTVKEFIADLREDGWLRTPTAPSPSQRPLLSCSSSWSSELDIFSIGLNKQIQAEYLRAAHGRHILPMS